VRSLLKLEKAIQDNKQVINATNFPWVLTWKSPFSIPSAGELNPSGENEHYLLSQRMRQRFPSILTQKYDSKRFLIQTTVVARAAQSANAFGYGLFGKDGPLPGQFQPFWTYSESKNQDYTLRFFENCPLYNTTKSSPKATKQAKAYFNHILPQVTDKLLTQLGSTRNWLNGDLVDAIYTACAFEVSAFGEQKKWCSLFDQVAIDQFEFLDDLEAYWQKSYGIPINYEMGCLLMSEIVDLFDQKLSGSSLSAKLRFAHAETVIPLITMLGLFKEDPNVMRWDAPQEQIDNRKFRSSLFSPFAGNVAFVLSNCSHGPTVQVLSNELPLIIPGCPSIECPYSTFKSLFAQYLQCDYKSLCQFPGSGNTINNESH